MKKLIKLSLVLMTAAGFAQNTVDKEVGSFNEIKVYDLIEVNLIKSDINKIIVKGDNIYDVKFVNKNGVLKLRMDTDSKFQGEDTFVEVYYTSFGIIDGNEGAKIVCNEIVEKDNLILRTQEGARIVVGMEVRDLEVKAVTGGIVEVSGLVKSQSVSINTGGVYEGRELKSEVASIKLSAGGEAEIFASEQIDVSVKAGGEVQVYGNPKNVNKKTMAGGRIVFKD